MSYSYDQRHIFPRLFSAKCVYIQNQIRVNRLSVQSVQRSRGSGCDALVMRERKRALNLYLLNRPDIEALEAHEQRSGLYTTGKGFWSVV
jgi:hypothetical protein